MFFFLYINQYLSGFLSFSHCFKTTDALFSIVYCRSWLSIAEWILFFPDIPDNIALCEEWMYSMLLNLQFGIIASHLCSISNLQVQNKMYSYFNTSKFFHCISLKLLFLNFCVSLYDATDNNFFSFKVSNSRWNSTFKFNRSSQTTKQKNKSPKLSFSLILSLTARKQQEDELRMQTRLP